jgi:hypothetical protein
VPTNKPPHTPTEALPDLLGRLYRTIGSAQLSGQRLDDINRSNATTTFEFKLVNKSALRISRHSCQCGLHMTLTLIRAISATYLTAISDLL